MSQIYIERNLINMKISGYAKLITSFFVGMLCICVSGCVFACTGIYIGKDVSADGSVMIARTEDMSSSSAKRFIVHPAQDHNAGEYYTDSYGLKVEYPSRTYRYSAVPGTGTAGIGDTPYGAAGFNECGLAATATITAYPNEAALAADPFIESGLHEISAADIMLSMASTAREAIELIADIVDEQGCGEGTIIMVADKNEAWYMEILSGHQYAAIKLPDDKAAVIPNAYMLETIDTDSPDTIVSDELVSLAEENGFLKKENGKINIRETYSVKMDNPNIIRIWGGRRLLGDTVGENAYSGHYSLLFTPDHKITVKEVMDVTRSRYEETKYDADLSENEGIRVIGTSRQEECHILQIRPDMPLETACVEWLCLSNSNYAPYIPYYAAAITKTPDMCRLDAPKYNQYSMYWAARSLNSICALNRNLYGKGVAEFYSQYEDNLIDYLSQSDVRMNASSDKTAQANKECFNLTYDAFNKSTAIYSQLMTFIADYEGRYELGDDLSDVSFKPDLSSDVDINGAYITQLPTMITVSE